MAPNGTILWARTQPQAQALRTIVFSRGLAPSSTAQSYQISFVDGSQNDGLPDLNNAPLGDFTMAVVWEQFAPTNTSQSLDESLDNLHNWAMGAPLSPAIVPVLATQSGLTVASQGSRDFVLFVGR